MTKKGTIQNCLVCGDTSSTIRFGAISCRACAEYFRRRVVSRNLNFENCSKKCQITRKGRKTCKSCRFQKCIEVGMLESQVASRTIVPKASGILDDLLKGYRQLESEREKLFGKIRKNRYLEYCNHTDFDDVCSKDIDLVFLYIIPIFKSKISVGRDQEEILANNFISQFILLETSFRSIGKPSYQLPNGQIFDNNHLDLLYRDAGGKEASEEICKPYWDTGRRVLKDPIDQMNLDCSEMLLLSALAYWDFGIPNQSDSCINECQKMRFRVYQELIDYLKSKVSDVSFRVIEVMNILLAPEKATNTIKNCGHIARVFDLKGKRCPIYEVMDC